MSWDVYHLSTDHTQTQNRNPASGPAIGAQVSFGVGSGDGSVDTTTVARMRKVMQ